MEAIAKKNNVTWFNGYVSREDREKLQSLFHDGQFLEIYVDCPPETCSKRDQKGLYAKAKAGIIKEFTGVSSPYEPPKNPGLTILSHEQSAKEAAARVIRLIQQHHIIKDALLDNEASEYRSGKALLAREGSESSFRLDGEIQGSRLIPINPKSQG